MNDIPILQLALTLISILSLFFINRLMLKLTSLLGNYKEVPIARLANIQIYLKILFFLVILLVIMTVWGVEYRGLLIFASSILAVIGVALVAQWSLLSNITASIIIFFSFPARIGDEVEVIDGNNVIKGTIAEINVFQIILTDEKGNTILYPTNLILQRPVRKLKLENKASKVNKGSTILARIQRKS